MNQKAITITLLVLMGTALLFVPLSLVQGQGALGFQIFQVTQQGRFTPTITSGNVDEAITVTAVLYTSGGQYLMYFGDKLVDSGTASGYYVASNFTIPQVNAGSYKITLTDVAIAQNTTMDFTINTAYLVQPVIPVSPARLQEGDNVVLNVSVTAGTPNTTYSANITVKQPDPLTGAYSRSVSLTTSSLGAANAQITYPDSSFTPSGSTTVYLGTYTAYFNQSANLGQSTFTVGITDKTEYHRQDTVKISAAGYQPSQAATVTIANEANSILSSQTVTASSQGTIQATWAVPSTAALGTYNVTIAPQGTAKAIPDSQTFTIIGYPASFRALNLAGEPVAPITIQVRDPANNQLYNATTDADGRATLNLESGTYDVAAYWNGVKVGETQASVGSNSSSDITCNLTNLKVTVKAAQGSQLIVVPYVSLNIAIQYGAGTSQTTTVQGQTDSSGVYILNSTLPDAKYTIDASKYGVVFNANNNTVSSLPAQASSQVNILSPTEALTLKTVDANSAALPNARIDLVELSSGIFYNATTDSTGAAQLQVVFGQYSAKVYAADNTLLNETVINVLSNTQSQIQCSLYNLKLTVKVVDYFGNPLSGVNVQLSRSGTNIGTAKTQSDGIATFDSIVGGNLIVTAYLSSNDNSYVSKSVQVNSPGVITLDMANFVSIGGLVVGVAVLATIAVIIVVVVILAALVVYRRTGHRLQRSK